jgi:D-3-phosphoglycerate dehydrogenase
VLGALAAFIIAPMKVLVADSLDPTGLEAVQAGGHAVELEPSLGTGDLPAALARIAPDVLVVRSTRVTAEAVEAAPALKLVVRAGAGTDTIDVPACSAAGVFVANCPGRNAVAVAELAWGLILACDRHIPDQVIDLREGRWRKKRYSAAAGLLGRTLGVIGTGTIGREVIARGQAFGMDVIAWSRSLGEDEAEELGVEAAASPIEVARRADVISLHIAGGEATRNLVDSIFVDAMRPGAILVNTARGSVVDLDAVADGIASKGIRVGLDVYPSEPGSGEADFALPLAGAVYGTHHVGASTDQAQEATALEAARVINEFGASGAVLNCVNRARPSASKWLLTVRHRNRPGVLAKVFDALSDAAINVEEMENVLYQGEQTACARIQLASAPARAELDRIAAGGDDILTIELSEPK